MSSFDDDIVEALRLLRRALSSRMGLTGLRLKIWIAEEDTPLSFPFPRTGGSGPVPPPDPNGHAAVGRPGGGGGMDGAPPPAPREATDDAPQDERRSPLAPCVRDILATLREVNKPLTKTRLFEEMARRGHEWGETTIMRYLKILMDDGTVANPPDATPRGYRLSEWEETSGEN